MLLRVLVISFPCVCCGLEFMRGGIIEGLPYRRRFVYESRCSWRRPTSDRCLVDGGVTGDFNKQMRSQHGVYEKRFMELVVSERVSYSSKQSNDFSMILCCLPALTYRRHSMPHPFVHWNLTDCCAPESNPKQAVSHFYAADLHFSFQNHATYLSWMMCFLLLLRRYRLLQIMKNDGFRYSSRMSYFG